MTTPTDTTPKPPRLAAGRYYRTRDGIKVGPAEDRGSYFSVGGVHYTREGVSAFEGVVHAFPRCTAKG